MTMPVVVMKRRKRLQMHSGSNIAVVSFVAADADRDAAAASMRRSTGVSPMRRRTKPQQLPARRPFPHKVVYCWILVCRGGRRAGIGPRPAGTAARLASQCSEATIRAMMKTQPPESIDSTMLTMTTMKMAATTMRMTTKQPRQHNDATTMLLMTMAVITRTMLMAEKKRRVVAAR